MSARFSTIDCYMTNLLPASLQDWLPEVHQARFVVDILDGPDLSALDVPTVVAASNCIIRRFCCRCCFTAMRPACFPAASWNKRPTTR